MANNRMFLIYKPTGDAVYLGKRMGWGWYGADYDDLQNAIMALFTKAAESGCDQDAFAIAMETTNDPNEHVLTDWQYECWYSTEPSPLVRKLILNPDVNPSDRNER